MALRDSPVAPGSFFGVAARLEDFLGAVLRLLADTVRDEHGHLEMAH